MLMGGGICQIVLSSLQKTLSFDSRYLDPKFRQSISTPFKEISHYDNFIALNNGSTLLSQNLDAHSYDKFLEYYLSTYKMCLEI